MFDVGIFSSDRESDSTLLNSLEPYVGGASSVFSVSTSDDGNTAVVFAQFGWPKFYVMVRSSSSWTVQYSSTGHNTPASNFIGPVCISGDGNYIAIGVGGSSGNFTEVYNRSGTIWSLQQSFSVPSSVDQFLRRMVMNSSGSRIAIIGYENNTGFDDYINVYHRSGTTWSLQQQLQRPNQPTAYVHISGLGMSGDGNTFIITQYTYPANSLVMYSYTWNGSAWVTGPSLALGIISTDGHIIKVDNNGTTVAICYDRFTYSSTAVIKLSGGTWSLLGTASGRLVDLTPAGDFVWTFVSPIIYQYTASGTVTLDYKVADEDMSITINEANSGFCQGDKVARNRALTDRYLVTFLSGDVAAKEYDWIKV